MKGSIDWDEEVYPISCSGELFALLEKLPKEQWFERDPYDGETLLHAAARGPNVKAVVALLQNGLDPNDFINATYPTAAHVAVDYGNIAVLKVLCASGAQVRQVLDCAICAENQWRHNGCLYVLLANGVRLGFASWKVRGNITPQMRAFESGVLKCRSAVVTLLLVKQKKRGWSHVDKFLMREIAFDVWCTRDDEKWTLRQ